MKASFYAVIGGCVGAVLTLAVCSFLPLGAQSQSDGVFESITCNRLRVQDAEGMTRVELFDDEDGGGVWIVGEDLWEARLNSGGLSVGNRREWTTIHREGLSVLGKDGGSVRLSVDKGLWMRGKDGSLVKLFHDEHGGHVSVFGKGDSKGQAGMAVTEYGNGGVSTWDKNGYRLATLK